jgi:hypothetical protein
MVMKAQQRMLMYDNKVLQALLRRGIDEQKWVLFVVRTHSADFLFASPLDRRLILEIRRSERDYELAFREFRELETKYKAALENWVSEEQRSKMDSRSSLTTITNVLRKSGYDRLSKIVKAASNGATAMDHAANVSLIYACGLQCVECPTLRQGTCREQFAGLQPYRGR